MSPVIAPAYPPQRGSRPQHGKETPGRAPWASHIEGMALERPTQLQDTGQHARDERPHTERAPR